MLMQGWQSLVKCAGLKSKRHPVGQSLRGFKSLPLHFTFVAVMQLIHSYEKNLMMPCPFFYQLFQFNFCAIRGK